VQQVSHLGGGFTAWKAAGAPVAEKARKPSAPAGPADAAGG